MGPLNFQRGPGALGPTYGVPGPATPYPAPNQAQSAPPNTGASVVAGIADFLQNYQRGQQAEQDRNKQDFISDVQMMMLGIPVDHTKMAKKAKAAGMDLDFEGTNAPPQVPQGAQQPQFPPT